MSDSSKAFRLATAAFLAGTCLASPAYAQADSEKVYPSKAVRLVVAGAAGTMQDLSARIIGQQLGESWRGPVVVDNRPGGGGILAARTVAQGAPDGHTLLLTAAPFLISAAQQPNLPYDPHKNFSGISQIGYATFVLVVAPALGVKSVNDLIALAKAQHGKLIFGSSATGGIGHLSGSRFNLSAGIKVVTVAFKGASEATIEVLAGRTHYCIVALGVAQPFLKDGKLRALAVLTPQRSPALPDVPALAEMLPEFRKPDTSMGLVAPAGTPRPIVNQISKEVARILDLPDIKEQLLLIGYVPAPSTPEEYDKILRDQIATLSKLIRDAGLRGQ